MFFIGLYYEVFGTMLRFGYRIVVDYTYHTADFLLLRPLVVVTP